MSTTKPTQDNKRDHPVRWYQVPVLWLCIAIFILTLAACAHLIMVSLEAEKNASTSAHHSSRFIFQNGQSAYQKHFNTETNEALS